MDDFVRESLPIRSSSAALPPPAPAPGVNRTGPPPPDPSAWPAHLSAAAVSLYAVISLLAAALLPRGHVVAGWLVLTWPAALIALGLSVALAWHRRPAARSLVVALTLAWSAAVALLRLPQTGWLDAEFALALGLAMLLPQRWRALRTGLGLAVGFAGLVSMFGCFFIRPGQWGPSNDFGPNFAWSLLMLAFGWLALESHERPVALLHDAGSAGWLTRRLLPLLVSFPLLFAWINAAATGAAAQSSHWHGGWVAAGGFVLASFLVFLTLVWKAAGALDRLDVSRADLQAYAHEISDLYHHAPCGYHSLDARGRFLNINDTELAWLGYRRNEVMQKLTFAELLTADSRRLFERHFTALCASGVRQDLELDMRRKDGSVLPAVVSTTVILDRSGRFLHTRSSVFDATQRKQAESALRASEARNRAILDSAADAIVTLTESGAIADFNPAAAHMFGLSPAAARTRPADDLLAADSPLRPLAPWAQAETAEEGSVPRRHEIQARRADGSTFPAEVALTRIAGQEPLLFTAFVRDLTDRKRAEAELRTSEERLRSVLDSTGEGICTVDMEGRCTLCNPAALRLLGFRGPEELVGRKMHPLIHHTRADGTLYPAAACRLLLAAQSGTGVDCDDEVFWRTDGSSFPVEYHSYPIHRAGQPIGLVIGFTDITARRAMEGQIRQSQKMEAVGRLAAGIAHDFNNLLTIINGYAEMLLDEAPDPIMADKLHSVHQAGERAAVLTQQLLAFSRQQMLQPQVLDLNAKIRDVEPLLRRTLGEDIEFQTRLSFELAPIKADPSQVDQILMNLVLNARDAIPARRAGATIRIETTSARFSEASVPPHSGLAAGEYVLLTVSDNGTGMRPDTQSHIFEPFFTTKPQGQGTGLGLPTVFGIARQSGGTVLVDSVWGRGTTMRVYFPADRSEVVPVAVTAPAVRAAGGGETLLLVEDEDGLRRMLLHLLRARGYTVLAAARPNEALEISRRHRGTIHLLISDVIMPDMHGPALAETLLRERPELQILFVSGYADHDLPPESFLKKPFAPEALANKVRGVLDSPSPTRKQTSAVAGS